LTDDDLSLCEHDPSYGFAIPEWFAESITSIIATKHVLSKLPVGFRYWATPIENDDEYVLVANDEALTTTLIHEKALLNDEALEDFIMIDMDYYR